MANFWDQVLQLKTCIYLYFSISRFFYWKSGKIVGNCQHFGSATLNGWFGEPAPGVGSKKSHLRWVVHEYLIYTGIQPLCAYKIIYIRIILLYTYNIYICTHYIYILYIYIMAYGPHLQAWHAMCHPCVHVRKLSFWMGRELPRRSRAQDVIMANQPTPLTSPFQNYGFHSRPYEGKPMDEVDWMIWAPGDL